MFTFEFELNGEDSFSLFLHNTYHVPANKKSLLRRRLTTPLIWLAFAIVYAIAFTDLFGCVFFIILALLWLATFDALMVWRTKRNIKKLEQAGNLHEKGSRAYCFEDDSFVYKTKTRMQKCSYAEIQRIDIGKQAIYLYTGVYGGAIEVFTFPNRIFTNEEEKKRFVAFMQGKISEANDHETPACCSGKAVPQ